jgi:hypothetical protein
MTCYQIISQRMWKFVEKMWNVNTHLEDLFYKLKLQAGVSFLCRLCIFVKAVVLVVTFSSVIERYVTDSMQQIDLTVLQPLTGLRRFIPFQIKVIIPSVLTSCN